MNDVHTHIKSDQQKVNLQYVNMRASVVPWIDILIHCNCLQ